MRIVALLVFLLLVAACAESNLVGDAKGGNGKPSEPAAQCADGKDNDNDGRCDFTGCEIGKGRNKQYLPADPDCDSAKDNTEAYVCNPIPEVCDGNDNDCDGLVDETGCAACNNGIVEQGEQCDNGNSNGACPASCSTSCNFNNCSVPVCGNNVKEAGELCDGTALNGQTCQSQGFAGGTLGCASNCQYFDNSSCFFNPTVENHCTDWDGSDFAQPGWINGSNDGDFYWLNDDCLTDELLLERTCSGSFQSNVTYNCRLMNGTCSGGACR